MCRRGCSAEQPLQSLTAADAVLCVPTAADLSAFALLEHADEDGYVENIEDFRDLVESAKPAKASKVVKGKQQAGKASSKPAAGNSRNSNTGAGTSRAASNQTNDTNKQARAEDYYRAFEHVYKDTSTGVCWLESRPSAGSAAVP
jgi:hypothetical protein